MKKKPREIELQDAITEFLTEHNIFPFSVTISYSIDSGVLGITFYFIQDLKDFLSLMGYEYLCDKSGYTILENTNTVLISGLPLVKLYTEL